MNAILLGLLAETFIHPGVGQTSGVIDLPVSREVATDYPFIPGSSLKGALKESLAASDYKPDLDALFGQQEAAGSFLISDARLLLLPVRSLTGAYKWVTCPHLLERFNRDQSRTGSSDVPEVPSNPKPTELMQVEAQVTGRNQARSLVFLEERSFRPSSDTLDSNWLRVIGGLINHETTKQRLSEQLVVLSDDNFVWFARYGLAVQARNVLDDRTKTSKNLWYEETLPPDTLMYAMVAERNAETAPLVDIRLCLEDSPWLQVGGNETVGQGWFHVALPEME